MTATGESPKKTFQHKRIHFAWEWSSGIWCSIFAFEFYFDTQQRKMTRGHERAG